MPLVSPHGRDTLTPLLLQEPLRSEMRKRALSLKRLSISSREAGDIIMLGIGGFTPLQGFMYQTDWQGVCDDMRMANKLFWPIPITLSTDDESIKEGEEITLYHQEEMMAIINVDEIYTIDKAHECQQVFKTTDPNHPGVRMVMDQGRYNLAGRLQVLTEGSFPARYPGLYLTPQETRDIFQQKGWSRVAAFQTRNPMHRAHEYLVKVALEVSDGVLIHSLLGQVKSGDIPAAVCTHAIDALVTQYFKENTVMQSGYPLDMRYAGPREALLHALFRQNYGCSHLIVGRDHAGVGDYYGAFDAHAIFDQIPQGALQTRPLKMDWTFWCNACEGMASMKTCPHDAMDRVLLSGTKLRKLLSEGQSIPAHFSRPEVIEILRAYYQGLSGEEKVGIELTGHSG